jgi:hypothetical protein
VSDSLCLSLLDSEEATLALRCWMGRWLGVLEAALLRRERGGLCVLGSIRLWWFARGVGHRGWQALPQGVLWTGASAVHSFGSGCCGIAVLRLLVSLVVGLAWIGGR